MDTACGTAVPEVPLDHHVVRLAKDDPDYLMWSEEQHRWLLKVPGNAIQFNEELSTLWLEHLAIHGVGAENLIEPPPGRALAFRASVGELVALGLNVRHTPTAPEVPECAHTSFDRPTLDKKARAALTLDISMLMVCVAGEITQDRPPGA